MAEEQKATMKGRLEYETALAKLPLNSSEIAYQDTVLELLTIQTELLMDMRDFMFSNQNMMMQNNQGIGQMVQALAEFGKMLTVITKVAGEFGVEKKYLKPMPKDDALDKAIRTQGGVVDLNQFKK